jgi:peroxiredoxin
MKSEKGNNHYASRLHHLQEKFRLLEPSIQDSEIKQALSLLYGMLQETLRTVNPGGDTQPMSKKETGPDVSNLFRSAPPMQGPALNKPLAPGSEAPDFALRDADGNFVKLSMFRGSRVLLVFYPLDWSPGCSQQLDLYQSEISGFERRKIKIMGISVDSIYSHGAWTMVRNLQIPLLSDFNPKGEVSKKYKVYRDTDGFSERALFLVDEEGTIQYSHVSPQLHHVPDIKELFIKLDEVFKTVLSK